jgi:hypothetical protein
MLCIRNFSQMLNKGENTPLFLCYTYTVQLVIHCFTLCVFVCVCNAKNIHTNNNNNNIISKRHEDTYRAISRTSIHKLQLLRTTMHSICAIFKPCLSGTTADSDPGVRQLWPSAHGAGGYWLASRRSNGTPSVINHPLATDPSDAFSLSLAAAQTRQSFNPHAVSRQAPDCLTALWLRGMSGHWQEQ